MIEHKDLDHRQTHKGCAAVAKPGGLTPAPTMKDESLSQGWRREAFCERKRPDVEWEKGKGTLSCIPGTDHRAAICENTEISGAVRSRWQPGASVAAVPVCAVSRDTGRTEHGLASAQGMDCRRQVFPETQMTHQAPNTEGQAGRGPWSDPGSSPPRGQDTLC